MSHDFWRIRSVPNERLFSSVAERCFLEWRKWVENVFKEHDALFQRIDWLFLQFCLLVVDFEKDDGADEQEKSDHDGEEDDDCEVEGIHIICFLSFVS